MHLKNLQSNWEQYARDDPMWAVLTDPERKGRKWTPEEFFASGRADIAQLKVYLDSLGLKIPTDSALDFGCGVGRLTQALCGLFSRVHGVDIAPSMIEAARKHNRHGDRCTFHLNYAADLSLIESNSLSFVYSVITLQHIPSHIQSHYIREFFRVLKPGGATVFRTLTTLTPWGLVPSRLLDLYRIVKYGKRPFMGAYGLSIRKVYNLIRESGGQLVELRVCPDDRGRFDWLAAQYCAVKPG